MASARTERWLRRAVAGLVFLLGVAAFTYAYRDTLGLADPSTEEQVEHLVHLVPVTGGRLVQDVPP